VFLSHARARTLVIETVDRRRDRYACVIADDYPRTRAGMIALARAYLATCIIARTVPIPPGTRVRVWSCDLANADTARLGRVGLALVGDIVLVATEEPDTLVIMDGAV
jgi:hypothetical protein